MSNLITIHNLQNNEVVVREMTEQELQQREKDNVEFAAFLQAKADKKAKREAALAKLETLGLDEADLKALGL